MSQSAPALIAIDPDGLCAQYVGKTADGRQFFLTNPFEPAIGNHPGCEFIALYLFDHRGALVDAAIDELGPRNQLGPSQILNMQAERLASLGAFSLERIQVAPFTIKKYGTEFGLLAREPEEEDDDWVVEASPGSYMTFFEPWDSGEYDT
jgi:hypothetical protein